MTRRPMLCLLSLFLLLFAALAHAQSDAGRRTDIGGYGEMHGEWSDDESELTLDRFVLFVGHEFTDKIRLYSETEIEDAHEVEMEQAYLEFVLSPTVSAEAGLVLVPLSRLNLQHEPPTYLTARRPLIERVITPTTWRELGAGIAWHPCDELALNAYALNGLDAHGFTAATAIRDGRQGGEEADGHDLAGAARAVWTPDLGVSLALAGYTGGASQDDPLLDGVAVHILSSDVEIARSNVQFRASGVLGMIDDAEKITDVNGEIVGSDFQGAAAEIGYTLFFPRSNARLTPFLRWESVRPQADLPDGVVGSAAPAVTNWTGGVSFRPVGRVAIKADIVVASSEGLEDETTFETALGFMF